jgi:phosphatidylglycerophosphatase C
VTGPVGDSNGGERPQAAAFDFDGTLTTGGSVWQFLAAMVGRRRLALAATVLAVKLARAAVFGEDAADEAKEALFRRTLAGLDVEEISARAAAFGLWHYRHRARADMRARLEWHRSRGHRLVIVSASPELYVRAAGEELDVDVVATRLEVSSDGLLTGSYDGKNCRGIEKLVRVQQWMSSPVVPEEPAEGADISRARDGGERPFLWAYGNSAGDVPLLAGADIGVDAGRLGKLGRLRRFTRLADLESVESPAAATSFAASDDTHAERGPERSKRGR